MASPVLRTEEGGEGGCARGPGGIGGESRKKEGGVARWRDHFISACGGGGRATGWHHVAGGGQEREREGEWGCPTGPVDGTRSAGVGSVARPCRAAGPNRGGLGADQWGPDTVVGDGG
jgi:hypothetical protein